MQNAAAPALSTDPEPVVFPQAELVLTAPHSAATLAYWRGLLRAPGVAPRLEDCDLLEIASSLPGCALLHIEREGAYWVRLFGTELVTRFGADLTGFNAFELFAEADRPGVLRRMERMASEPAIVRTLSSVITPNGINLIAEWVFLPLTGKTGLVDHALVVIAPEEAGSPRPEQNLTGTLQSRKLIEINFATI